MPFAFLFILSLALYSGANNNNKSTKQETTTEKTISKTLIRIVKLLLKKNLVKILDLIFI